MFWEINYFIYIYNRIEVRMILVISVVNRFFCAKVNKNIYVFLRFEVVWDSPELVVFLVMIGLSVYIVLRKYL